MGEGDRGKRVTTTSDDEGDKCVSEKSKSTDSKCVSENSTGGKSGTTRNSDNPFDSEESRRDKLKYFVDVSKDKRTKNNNFEFQDIRSTVTQHLIPCPTLPTIKPC